MDFQEFASLAEHHTVVPVSTSLVADLLTPVSAYMRLRLKGGSGSFLLESVEGGERHARYSFIGRNPVMLLKCLRGTTTITDAGGTTSSQANFFDILGRIAGGFRQPRVAGLPSFTGGLVGFVGYDAIRFLENIPDTTTGDNTVADSMLALFPSVVAFDHLKHHAIIIVNALIRKEEDLKTQYERALAEIREIESCLRTREVAPEPFRTLTGPPRAETTRDEFCSIVRKAKEHIRDGDIFQVVLSQRFSKQFEGDPFTAYRALRCINPSPYMYFLEFPEITVIGSSPEILVRSRDGTAEVFPIAGTRPRGKSEEEDRILEKELLADEKERAEHVMLVDLGRNDLGRICLPGSVEVRDLMTVVRYSHVMHIASRVVGTLPEGTSPVDVLKATFPAGTVSGAPKIRAMQLIDELEKTRRGMYAGGVGYVDFSGSLDMCIAIRTMFTNGDRLYLQSGAGIVADSEPDREYDETIHKAGAMVEALEKANEIRS